MDNTCNKDCKFGQIFNSEEECPHYIEHYFENQNGERKLVKDCAPRRHTLMIKDIYNRLEGIQKSMEQTRNGTVKVVSLLNNILIETSKRNGEIYEITE